MLCGRPPSCMPSVSGFDSELGLIMIRPVVYWSAIDLIWYWSAKQQFLDIFGFFWTSGYLYLWSIELKNGTPLTLVTLFSVYILLLRIWNVASKDVGGAYGADIMRPPVRVAEGLRRRQWTRPHSVCSRHWSRNMHNAAAWKSSAADDSSMLRK